MTHPYDNRTPSTTGAGGGGGTRITILTPRVTVASILLRASAAGSEADTSVGGISDGAATATASASAGGGGEGVYRRGGTAKKRRSHGVPAPVLNPQFAVAVCRQLTYYARWCMIWSEWCKAVHACYRNELQSDEPAPPPKQSPTAGGGGGGGGGAARSGGDGGGASSAAVAAKVTAPADAKSLRKRIRNRARSLERARRRGVALPAASAANASAAAGTASSASAAAAVKDDSSDDEPDTPTLTSPAQSPSSAAIYESQHGWKAIAEMLLGQRTKLLALIALIQPTAPARNPNSPHSVVQSPNTTSK